MPVRFADIVDADVLGYATGTKPDRILEYADSQDQRRFYTAIEIPKRGRRRRGQFRVVYRAEKEWLGHFHRMLALLVHQNTTFPEHVQGFVDNRSALTNAKLHVGASVLLHGDLANFFDTITLAQVKQAFLTLGAPANVAPLLARSSTIDGLLRQGTRCSPIVANIVCRHLDNDLAELARVHDARYSRYGDNITISGDTVPRSDAVGEIVRSRGFILRDGGCWEQRRGRSQYVTGLSICGDRPRLPRLMKRRVRLVLHYIKKYGVDDHLAHVNRPSRNMRDQRAIEGMLRYFNSIEPGLTERLRENFHRGLAISRQARRSDPPKG